MDFIKIIMELPGEKRSQDVVESVEWNNLWRQIVVQGNHSENYLQELYDYLFDQVEGWVYKVQAELDGVQPYLEGVMTQPVGKAPDGSLWTYPSTESGTVPWGNIMGDITRQQDLIQELDAKADTEHRHDINTLTFNEGDIESSWINYNSQDIPTSALKDLSVTSEKLSNGAVTIAKIASGAVINNSIANGAVSGVKIANASVTRAKLAADVKPLSFVNVSVASANWELESTPTYTDFPHRATVSLADVTANHFPQVVLSPADATSGAFCPVVDSYEGGVYIYSDGTNEADMTIPVIVCTPVA